jgi:hypothetical protein
MGNLVGIWGTLAIGMFSWGYMPIFANYMNLGSALLFSVVFSFGLVFLSLYSLLA